MKNNVSQLLNQYLPPHEITHYEVESFSVGKTSFIAAGVAVKIKSTGLEVYGSSSGDSEETARYAAFEILERYSLLSRQDKTLPSSSRVKYSLSNGVALHTDPDISKESAFLELAERNELLKSWYFNTPVINITHSLDSEIDGYTVKAYEFSNEKGLSVVGIFAFSTSLEKAPVYGFGAGRNRREACRKANKEFCTRFGFIHDEISSEDPEFSATADYHQDFYLNPKNQHHLVEWLEGHNKIKTNRYCLKDIEFFNLTPQDWKGLYIIQAKSPESIPLFFGDASSVGFDFKFRYGIPHPII